MSKISFNWLIVIITSIVIILNFSNYFMGNHATFLNLIVSITFLLLWFLFSFYNGKNRNKKYLKFILIYWGINIVSSILIVIVSISSYDGILLIPFSIWYNCPTYGIRYLVTGNVSKLVLTTMPLGLLFSCSGYYIGIIIPKFKKIA